MSNILQCDFCDKEIIYHGSRDVLLPPMETHKSVYIGAFVLGGSVTSTQTFSDSTTGSISPAKWDICATCLHSILTDVLISKEETDETN